jgi:beta-N-acetylhexosaminidase
VRAGSGVAAAALAAAAVTGCGGSGGSDGGAATAPAHRATEPAAPGGLSLRRQVGQLLILSFHGTTTPGYVGNILRDGTAGGAILFRENVASPGQLRSLTGGLQRAGRGSVLVAADQEGGTVRVVDFAASAIGQADQRTPAAAGAAARAAARDLRGDGVNVNLAPVADVADASGSAVGGRAYPGGPAAVAANVTAAVRGAAAGRGAATAKHFPGFGAGDQNTDRGPVTISRPAGALRADLVPFRAAVDAGVPLVMASHALYPALDPGRIASQSPAVLRSLLRGELRFRGAIITDSIEARAVIRRSDVGTAAVRSVAAGADLVLMTGPGSFRLVFPRLLAEARRSVTFRTRVSDAVERVLALKRRLGLRPPA